MSDQPTSEPTFTFTIEFITAERMGGDSAGSWFVHLDHQCSDWQIAGGQWCEDDITKREAVDSLRTFIAEAKETLEALIALPDVPDVMLGWTIEDGVTFP